MRFQFERSKTERKLCGVIGGISKTFGIDATFLRVVFVLLTIPTGFIPLTIIYGVLAYVMPNEDGLITS